MTPKLLFQDLFSSVIVNFRNQTNSNFKIHTTKFSEVLHQRRTWQLPGKHPVKGRYSQSIGYSIHYFDIWSLENLSKRTKKKNSVLFIGSQGFRTQVQLEEKRHKFITEWKNFVSYSMKKHITQSSDQPKLKGKVKFNKKIIML